MVMNSLKSVTEVSKMIHPNSQKTSFDIRLPHDPHSKCNKFITKGYSMSLCFLNICIKAGISIAIIVILFHQFTPKKIFQDIKRSLITQNISLYKNHNTKI